MLKSKHKTTLEQWRIIQAVVDHGGYAQAAEALYRSPSSLNHAVSKLQQQLGVEILEVRGRKAFLTPQGEVLLRRSRQLTEGAYQLETLADNLEIGWEPEITLAVEPLIPRQQLFNTLKDFYPDSRGTRLRIKETIITGTSEAITEGSADLVICGTLPKGYLGESLGTIEMIAVTRSDHPLQLLDAPIDQQILSNELQIVISDSGRKPQENQGWLRSEQRWTVDNFDAAIDLLATGIGFCWLPRHRVAEAIQAGLLKALQIREGDVRTIPIYLVIPKPDQLGPCAQELLLHLRDLPRPLG